MTKTKITTGIRKTELSVFIVEDSPLIRDRLIESIADGGGFIEIVGVADTESDALLGIKHYQPDVAVIDIRLRIGNGLNLICELRKSYTKTALCIIVLTNYAFPDFRNKSVELGANHFFDKAHDFDHVRAVLNDLVANRPEISN